MELTQSTTVEQALNFLGSSEVQEKLGTMISGARAEFEKRLKRSLNSLHDLPADTLVCSDPLAKKNVEGVLWFFKGQRNR